MPTEINTELLLAVNDSEQKSLEKGILTTCDALVISWNNATDNERICKLLAVIYSGGVYACIQPKSVCNIKACENDKAADLLVKDSSYCQSQFFNLLGCVNKCLTGGKEV